MTNDDIGEHPSDQVDRDSRFWGVLCHLSGLAGYMGVPLGNFVGPLIVWLYKKDQYRLVDKQGKDAFNFQVTIFITWNISAVLAFVLIGIVSIIILYSVGLVSTIKASINTSNGVPYRYPFSIRFLK